MHKELNHSKALLNDVVAIDCQYRAPEHAAAYLMLEGDEAAFVDANTTYAVPLLLEALAAAGRRPEDVRYLVITHVHLDHAGGAGALLEQCPRAEILCHPRAARHLIEPSRLIASARQVYGDETFNRLYGEIRPIAADRVRSVADEERVVFGARTLRFLHTLGHATHHVCIYDSGTNGVFTGDAFGTRYPELGPTERPFLLCSTPPTDFDPEEALKTAERIAALGADWAFPTHFGPIPDPAGSAPDLIEDIRAMGAILAEAIARPETGPALEAWCFNRAQSAFAIHCARAGVNDSVRAADLCRRDLRINAQGLAYKAERLRG